MKKRNPFLTIVIVTLNDDENFVKTMNSLLHQNFYDWEAVIIEGGAASSFLTQYVEGIDANTSFLSEKDFGIYDAMNKGIKKSKGEWVLFLNSGDEIYSMDTLHKLSMFLKESDMDSDVLYGDAQLLGNLRPRRLRAKPISQLKTGMITCHQAVVFNQKTLTKFRYNLNLNICSDYDLLCQIYQSGHKHWLQCDLIICKYIAGGFSDRNRIRKNIEEYNIARWHFGPSLALRIKFSFRVTVSLIVGQLSRIWRAPSKI